MGGGGGGAGVVGFMIFSLKVDKGDMVYFQNWALTVGKKQSKNRAPRSGFKPLPLARGLTRVMDPFGSLLSGRSVGFLQTLDPKPKSQTKP